MSSGDAQPSTQGQKRPHPGAERSGLRTARACRACRERKTRCSGHQPTCAYCLKAGVPCEYAPTLLTYATGNANSTFDEWGEKILTAVNSLAHDLKSSPGYTGNSHSSIEIEPPSTGINLREDPTTLHANFADGQPGCIPIEGPSPITSLPSILAWSVFLRHDDVLARFSLSLSEYVRQARASQTSGKESASCAGSDLLALASIFEDRYLPEVPILDMTELRGYIAYIIEFGDLWNAESCLVLLVAALASLPTHNDDSSPIVISQDPILRNATNSGVGTTKSALGYWNMAKKRLAWALEESGILGAQCQFLAGIWYLYASEPVAAWQMLSGSLQAIDSTSPRRDPRIVSAQQTDSELLSENIRWICLDLLCRLACEEEVSIRPSIYKLSEPDTTGSWATEHASILQLRQNTLALFRTLHADMSLNEICSLYEKLVAAKRALDDWYSRIPMHLRWSTDETTVIHPTSGGRYQAYLQTRYLETRELILRPSTYVLWHVQCLQRSTNAPGSSMLNDILCNHYRIQFKVMSLQHGALISARLDSYQNPDTEQPLSDAGWLRTRSCLGLALLLMATERVISRDSAGEGSSLNGDYTSVLDGIERSFRNDRTSGPAKIYANLLHDLRAS